MILDGFFDTILEEIWKRFGHKSLFGRLLILEEFFDTILEEIRRVGNSFWKRFGRDLATNHYLEDFWHDFGRVVRHDFGRDWESDGRVRPKIEKSIPVEISRVNLCIRIVATKHQSHVVSNYKMKFQVQSIPFYKIQRPRSTSPILTRKYSCSKLTCFYVAK